MCIASRGVAGVAPADAASDSFIALRFAKQNRSMPDGLTDFSLHLDHALVCRAQRASGFMERNDVLTAYHHALEFVMVSTSFFMLKLTVAPATTAVT